MTRTRVPRRRACAPSGEVRAATPCLALRTIAELCTKLPADSWSSHHRQLSCMHWQSPPAFTASTSTAQHSTALPAACVELCTRQRQAMLLADVITTLRLNKGRVSSTDGGNGAGTPSAGSRSEGGVACQPTRSSAVRHSGRDVSIYAPVGFAKASYYQVCCTCAV